MNFGIRYNGTLDEIEADSHTEAEYLVDCYVRAGLLPHGTTVDGEIVEEVWLTEDEYKEFLAGLNPWEDGHEAE